MSENCEHFMPFLGENSFFWVFVLQNIFGMVNTVNSDWTVSGRAVGSGLHGLHMLFCCKN